MRYLFYSSKPVNKKWDDTWGSDRIERHLDTLTDFPQLIGLFRVHLKPGLRILEAGCGMGRWVIHLTQQGQDIIGLDYSKRALRSIREYDKELQVGMGDVTDLPYKDDTFDVYLSFGVIEHIEKGRERVLKEAFRILRPGGLIIISVPLLNWIARTMWCVNRIRYGFRRDRHYFEEAMTEKALRRLLEENGFDVIDSTGYGHFTTLNVLLPFVRMKSQRGGQATADFNTLGKKLNSIIEEFPDSSFLSRQLAHMIAYVGRSRKG